MIRISLICILSSVLFSSLSAQTSLSGKVTDEASNEPLIFCTVGLFKNGVPAASGETDLDGNYSFSNLDPGTYELLVSYTGYQQQKITDVVILAGKANRLDVKMTDNGGVVLDEIVVVEYRAPLVEQDNTTSGAVITSDQIRNLPTRNINALATTSAGLSSSDEGGSVTVRGSRPDATDYYIDGIRVQGSLIPESEIDQLQVITGGIEAKYGDVTGGIISITTKGPSNTFRGGLEVETSNFLDAYDNTLVGFNVSGPILKNSADAAILGFRLAGRYTNRVDDDPPGIDVFRIKDEKLAELQENPIIDIGGNPFVAADFLTEDDVESVAAKPFENQERIDLTAKLDAQVTNSIDVTFTGAYRNDANQFTPDSRNPSLPISIRNPSGDRNWRVLNSHNNPFSRVENFRGNFRFRHRVGRGQDNNNKQRKLIRDFTYILQGGYEKRFRDITDERHQFDYFNYGYVGKFDIEWVPTFTEITDPITQVSFLEHTDYRQVLRGYTPGTINPVLANYNNALGVNFDSSEPLNAQLSNFLITSGGSDESLLARDAFYAPNGTISNVFTQSWNFHSNVGTVYNQARKLEDDIITFNANASFDVVPGSSDKGRHHIEVGVLYEKRINRNYAVFPRRLWDIARQQANNHILGIAENPDTVGMIEIAGFRETPLLQLTIAGGDDNLFYRKIRDEDNLNVPLSTYVNVDGLDPSQLSLDLFSAKELNDQNLLDYYGFDYLGNTFNGSWEDFFTTRDPIYDVRTFPVAPNTPEYFAGYIQDKFTFKDIIFRLGVRIDRYDANTKVLRDNYSLYDILGAGAYHASFGGEKPGNIGNDYKVYLNESETGVQAYRDGDQWFQADGTPVNSSIEIEGIRSGLVFPVFADPNAQGNPNYIKSQAFAEVKNVSRDPNVTTSRSGIDMNFEDYKPQINIMPRLAFSFPISADANFFAHYDILVQRPPSNTIATARDYFYFIDNSSQLFNNPNLLPEKTIDYEVGFQQKLSRNSALKLAAYYKELRDMIQQRTFFPVPFVNQYTTYDNQDFGTVKGFTAQYDLRRTPTNNVSFQANYTLQFADGTGSSANSQGGLTSRGNLRNLFPLNFDERHRIVATLDYRFRDGGSYLGPELFDLPIFANAGANLQLIAVSGRPYTAELVPIELGGSGNAGALNGSRKPWNFTVNLRLDKSFKIRDKLNMNVYMRISNVLDRKNIINVYSATGSPTDDGFLQSALGQNQINNILNSQRLLESYLASYQWVLLNPNNYTLPRRIFVGAIMDF